MINCIVSITALNVENYFAKILSKKKLFIHLVFDKTPPTVVLPVFRVWEIHIRVFYIFTPTGGLFVFSCWFYYLINSAPDLDVRRLTITFWWDIVYRLIILFLVLLLELVAIWINTFSFIEFNIRNSRETIISKK